MLRIMLMMNFLSDNGRVGCSPAWLLQILELESLYDSMNLGASTFSFLTQKIMFVPPL